MEDHLEPSRAEGPFDLGHLDAHAGHGTARRLQVKEHLINHRLLPADIARVARSQQARKACAAEDNPLSPGHMHLHGHARATPHAAPETPEHFLLS